MKKKFSFLTICTLCLLTLVPFGGSAQDTLQLETAVKKALEKNHGILIANNTAKISENNAKPGNAGLLPKVGLNAGGSYSLNNSKLTFAGNIPEVAIDGAQSNSINASVGLNYTLFSGLGTVYNFRKLQVNAESGELQARLTIENTLLQVINSYYEVARLADQYQLLRETFTISKDRYERAKSRYEIGGASRLEMLSASVDMNSDSVQLVTLAAQMNNAKRTLSQLMGDAPDAQFQVNPKVQYAQNLALADLQSKAKEQNTAVLLAHQSQKVAALDMQITQAAAYPRLDLSSSYGYARSQSDASIVLENQNIGFNGGLTLSFNIFDGRRRATLSQNAIMAFQNSQLQLEQASLQMETEVLNLFALYRDYQTILNLEEANLPTAQLNFDRTKELQRLGQVTSTQFREAQLNLLRSKSRITNARINAKLAEVQLLKLSGELLKAE